MENQENNNGEKQPERKPETQPQQPGRKRFPTWAIVWFVIFAVLGILIVLNPKFMGKQRKLDWSDFERRLVAGEIISAKLTEEPDQSVVISGKYRLSAKELRNVKLKNPKAPGYGHYSTQVIYSPQLDQMLRTYVRVRKASSKSGWWNLILTSLPLIILIIIIYIIFSRQIKSAGRGALQFGKSRARMVLPDDLRTTFDDIAGADEAKEETKEIVDFLKDPLKFKLLGGRIPKGALLTGPPGTGKTLMAKAVACEAGVPFFSISGSDFVEMFVGVGASRVRDMFEQARKHAPCLIFIDEIDAVGRSRFSGMGGGHDEREQTLNALLVEMDGLETQSGVILLAATNRPDVLDQALLRPGRFDRQIVLDLPDIKGRRKILEIHAKKVKVDKNVELEKIARASSGFSGADLENLCNEAALLAAREDRPAANMKDFEEARDKVRWGRERRSRRISERERKLTAYHEAGHTLLCLNCKHSIPLHKVTIIPRGTAYLGATMNIPKEDVYTKSRNELLDEIAVLMGGRAAEELVIKDITTGAASDIEEATRIARLMVCTFGMNNKIGPIQYSAKHEHVHVRVDSPPSDSYSQETAREIDEEIKKLINDAHSRALDVLTEKSQDLETLAQELLQKETLSANEIRELLGMEPIAENDEAS